MQALQKLIEEIVDTSAEINYYAALAELNNQVLFLYEISTVGAEIGGGFHQTSVLHEMKNYEVMKSLDEKMWEEEVDNEDNRITKNNIQNVFKRRTVNKGTKILNSTWVMEKKSNQKLQGRVNL